MKYIDADALIEFIDVGHLRHPSELCFSELDVVNMLNHAPSADVVEVVRCKECEHYDDGLCRRWKYSHVTSEDSFCSGAERRTDEQIH